MKKHLQCLVFMAYSSLTAPYRVTSQGSLQIIKPFLWVNRLILLACIPYLYYDYFYVQVPNDRPMDAFLVLGLVRNSIMGLYMGIGTITLVMSFQKVVNFVNQITALLFELPLSQDQIKSCSIIVALQIIATIWMTFISCASSMSSSNFWPLALLHSLTTTLPYIATLYAEVIFLDFLGMLILLFRNLQSEIGKHAEIQENPGFNLRRPKPTTPRLKQLNSLYTRLQILQTQIREQYSLMMLINVTYSFAEIVFLVFLNIFQLEYGSVLIENRIRAAILKTMSPSVIVKLLVIIVVCGHFSRVAKRTGLVLHKYWTFVPGCTPQLFHQIRTFSQEIVHSTTKVTACDFFTIDNSLIVAMVGAITTYTVILLQFNFPVTEYNPIKNLLYFVKSN